MRYSIAVITSIERAAAAIRNRIWARQSASAAETVVGLTDAFKPVPDRRGLYAPNLALRRAAVASRFAAKA